MRDGGLLVASRRANRNHRIWRRCLRRGAPGTFVISGLFVWFYNLYNLVDGTDGTVGTATVFPSGVMKLASRWCWDCGGERWVLAFPLAADPNVHGGFRHECYRLYSERRHLDQCFSRSADALVVADRAGGLI